MSNKLRFRDNSGNLIPYELDTCPFPIGHIIANALSSFDPNKEYPNTKWSRYAKGRTLVGVNESDGEFSYAGKVGGAKTVTLNVNQIPPHSHTTYNKGKNILYDTGNYDEAFGWHANTSLGYRASPEHVSSLVGINNTGGGQAHNNLQPYITSYMWIRNA